MQVVHRSLGLMSYDGSSLKLIPPPTQIPQLVWVPTTATADVKGRPMSAKTAEKALSQ